MRFSLLVASIWKFLNLEQELLLLSVINVRFVSQDLITLFQGLGFADLDIFDLLLSSLPAEYRGQVGYNVLTDNAQYHPNIFLRRVVLSSRK